jgi:hypothetical protein
MTPQANRGPLAPGRFGVAEPLPLNRQFTYELLVSFAVVSAVRETV